MNDGASVGRRALFVCEEAPWSNANGASAYNSAVIAVMRDLVESIDVLVTGPQPDPISDNASRPSGVERVWHLHAAGAGRLAALTGLAKDMLRTALAPFLRRRRRAKFGRWLSQADVAAIKRMVDTGTIDPTRYDFMLVDTIFRSDALASLACVKPILVGHDIFFKRAESFSRNGYTVVTQIDEAKEVALWRRFAGVIAISQSDRDIIAAHLGDKAITIYPVASSASEATGAESTAGDILFIGSGAYHNVDGLAWFLEEHWPDIRLRHPQTHLHVVGTIDGKLSQRPGGVIFHGRVENSSTIARQCSFAISPLRMGSGIKIKMIDYFRLGLPCVATRVAAEGFPTKPNPPFVTTEADAAFADSICHWLTDRGARNRQAAAIPAYLDLFSHARAVAETRRLLAQTNA